MGKLLKRAALIGATAGAVSGMAYALKAYLEKPGGADEGAVQISFEDGTSESLGSAESEEFTDIARSVLRTSGR